MDQKLVGAFEVKPESQIVTGFCPVCKSPDIYATWRDIVWNETHYACNACEHDWIKA